MSRYVDQPASFMHSILIPDYQKHPKAKNFRNSGWAHYKNIQRLLGGPGLARGSHAYRASQGSTNAVPTIGEVGHGAASSSEVAPTHNEADSSDHSENVNRDGDGGGSPGMDGDGDDVVRGDGGGGRSVTLGENEDILGSDNDIMPPPPSSVTTTSTSKRKFSAVATTSEDPSSFSRTPSASATPSSFSSTSKRGRMSGAVALNRLGDTLSDFTTSFRTSVQRRDQPPVDPTVERKNTAMERAQDLETDLSDDQLAALLELFQSDVSTADAYMVIKREPLRKAWVQRKLKLSGITFLGEDHELL
jgi:hypothetical protein